MFKAKNFPSRKACVLGMGRSGLAVARLLAEKGFSVLVSEEVSLSLPVQGSMPEGVTFEIGGHTEKVFDADFIVKSPGIFPKNPILQEAKSRKIPVFSELEIALSFLPKGVRIFAVTGTNGKTTTTSLLGKILKENAAATDGHQVFVCGNIGNPISSLVSSVRPKDDLVIEVSSYQLEDSTYFRPNFACLLNVTPDHLDHHGGMKNYIRAKMRITRNQRAEDVLVVNGAESIGAELAEKTKARLFAFSANPKHLLKTDVFFDGDEMIFSEGYQMYPPQLKGIHNVENAMAASLMALAAGIKEEILQKAFADFKAMEHRIEQFAYHRGITYVNDSKATNLDSTITALKSFEKKPHIWLILGGRDKGASYEVLLPYLKTYCKRVLSIGEAMDKIEKELGDFPVTRCGNLETVVNLVMTEAIKGDVILLSPACASFDQFKDYEQRGRIFKHLVNSRIFKHRIKH